jgi:PAS domain S-box-containing protein
MRRQAEAALAASETRFRSVVESAPDGVAILRGTTVLYLNPAAAQMLGYDTATSVIGQSVLGLIHPDDAPLARERIAELVRSKAPLSAPTEYRSRRVDGREIVVEISSIPIDYDGAPAVLAFARDITERKAIQARLVEADRLAALGTLAAGIAHEINNPLAYVLLGLEYIERDLASAEPRIEELRQRLRDVRGGAERVGTIVRDLKTFARADGVSQGPVDIRAVIDAAAKMVDNEIRHRARLVRDYGDAPPALGNAARLEQVFLNLLVNAVHALPDGDSNRQEIRVTVRQYDPHSLEVQVTDSGCGIPEELRPRIFDPFFTTKPVGVGTGLGLPICRSIVESLGGRIELSSELGRGTTVTVTLRAYAGPPSSVVHSPARAARVVATRSRLLIVDDEPMVASLLKGMLEPSHVAVVASNGIEALAALESESFDAILCDVMMPGMTGMDFHAALSDRSPALAHRVIFMTGGAFVPRISEFLARVDNPTLDKPFGLHELEAALIRLHGRS